MIILIWAFIFLLGFSVGYTVKRWLTRRVSTSGIIYVTHGEEKTLYSLELNDYPDAIDFKKVVVFKVEHADKDSNRE